MKAPVNSKLAIPPHLVRRPDAAGRKACSRRKVAAEPAAYPPGYFLALVRQHNWPPRFEPSCHGDGGRAARLQAQSRAMREAGLGYETLPLNLPGAQEHVQRWAAQKVARATAKAAHG